VKTPQQTHLYLQPQAWETLRSSYAAYKSETSPEYDEVLNEVSERIRATGSIAKTDIGALLFWKRLRADTTWVRSLMAQPEKEIRSITEKAVSAVNDASMTVPQAAAAGRSELTPLPTQGRGCTRIGAPPGGAPERMAVYDKHAQIGLETLGLSLSPAPGRYRRYMELVEGLRSTVNPMDIPGLLGTCGLAGRSHNRKHSIVFARVLPALSTSEKQYGLLSKACLWIFRSIPS
jgi:hypothetical protein